LQFANNRHGWPIQHRRRIVRSIHHPASAAAAWRDRFLYSYFRTRSYFETALSGADVPTCRWPGETCIPFEA
jgi:hypothetical protein